MRKKPCFTNFTYCQHRADVTVRRAVFAEDDFPIFEVRDVWRNSEVEKRENVYARRNVLESQTFSRNIVGDCSVVKDDDLFLEVDVSTGLDQGQVDNIQRLKPAGPPGGVAVSLQYSGDVHC